MVERRFVVPKVVGSNPTNHPIFLVLGLNYLFLLPLGLFFVGFGGILFNRRSIIAIIICMNIIEFIKNTDFNLNK